MNRAELIEKIAASAEVSKAVAKKTLDITTEVIKEALAAGDRVQLVGFGTFATTKRPAHEGINPGSREEIKIAAKKVAESKAGAELADVISK